MVTAADVGDRAAAQVLLTQVTAAHHLLALVLADGGYTGSLAEYCLAALAGQRALPAPSRPEDRRAEGEARRGAGPGHTTARAASGLWQPAPSPVPRACFQPGVRTPARRPASRLVVNA
uniref:Transposase IS4-like domain-containing protein n=1 Tax=Streptomyces sp. NBC_00049 TaxID=2903617 RepID=A0AAU2K1V1_9ACTN